MTFKENGPQTKLQLDQMITNLRSMNINAPLVWLWVWDSIVDIYNQNRQENDEYTIKEDITLDKMFEDLWANPPADFTLEYGTDQLDEAILDWMIDNDYMIRLDDDGWLDDEEENEEENEEEVIPQVTGIDSLNRQRPKGWEL